MSEAFDTRRWSPVRVGDVWAKRRKRESHVVLVLRRGGYPDCFDLLVLDGRFAVGGKLVQPGCVAENVLAFWVHHLAERVA